MVELKRNVWKVSNSPKIRSAPEISENCHPAAHGLPPAPFPADHWPEYDPAERRGGGGLEPFSLEPVLEQAAFA